MCEECARILEEIKAIYAEIKDLVSSLRAEEERSHARREEILQEWLDEARRVREILEDISSLVNEVRSRFF